MEAVVQEASVSKKTEYKTVRMEDGRTVEFPSTKRMIKEVMVEPRVGVRFDFINGATRTFYVPDSVIKNAAAHGYSQKLGDYVAGMKNEDKTGPADEDDLILEIESLHERIEKDGQWKAERDGIGAGGTSLLLRAIMEHKGKDREWVKAILDKKTNQEKAALRESPSLRPIIERLRAEKNQKASQVGEALLGEFA